ncbi:hypothetical protein MJO28_009145 [Puccinia striiformis f. sp. tritici]|uniref:Uncharacterized protein n=1 Tax=Puccinia striiformis f. sp. tritici TaxID=168172 RepID=A0ACC0E7L9_9BASI|nr:hypothetical protein MJO28_009145 [Puccinia striiformis f. sp. tritici]
MSAAFDWRIENRESRWVSEIEITQLSPLALIPRWPTTLPPTIQDHHQVAGAKSSPQSSECASLLGLPVQATPSRAIFHQQRNGSRSA